MNPSIIGILSAESFKIDIRDELQQIDSEPYYKGLAAYLQQKHINACPYTLSTVESALWFMGHDKGKEQTN